MRRHIVFLVLFLPACSSSPLAPSSVEEAKILWDRAGLADYTMHVTVECFCPPEVLVPVEVVVRGGAVVEVTDRETGQPRPESLIEAGTWPTVPELFEEIRAYRADGRLVEVNYDRYRGHPTVAELGELATDAGVRYRIDRLGP